MDEREMTPCTECGMPCRTGEYHPYAACLMFKACHNSDTVRGNLQDVFDAGRRTTPDREALIEECAKVCESVAAELLQPGDEEAVAGCVFCRDAIRSLKTAPTSDKGGAR